MIFLKKSFDEKARSVLDLTADFYKLNYSKTYIENFNGSLELKWK